MPRKRPGYALILSTLVLFALPGAALAAGLAFVPGGEPAHVHPVRPDLSVLTYRVPGGLMVADRVAPGNRNRFGASFDPRHPDSEFFLIRAKGRAHDPDRVHAAVDALGHVHWARDDVLVVEITAAGRETFLALDVDRVRIPLDAPPAGWDRRRGDPVAPPARRRDKSEALIGDFVASVSGPAFFQLIQEISGHAYFYFDGLKSVSTRFYDTADKDLVADFLAAKLAGWGYAVTFDEFTQAGHPCRNIVATKAGTTLPDEYVVVGGHYDSISADPRNRAPGAEDNGSGTSSVMEIARIAAGRSFERTVQFVLFDSEEQGLYGSQHFVDDAVTAGRDIIAAVTMDMVAYHDTHYAVRIEGETPWEWLMSIMETKTELYTDIGNQKDYNSWGSDHVPFQQAGIPAFLAIDYDYGSYPAYHGTDDNWIRITDTAQIGVEITRACAATLAEVAVLQPDLSAVDEAPVRGRIDMTAYPNPFNPQVTIIFSPARDVTGEVAVYDLTGRRVAVLARGDFRRGLNRIEWNGRDASGRGVASGSYVCRLVADGLAAAVTVNLVR